MPHPAPLRLLPPAARPIRPTSPHPRLARGGSDCRVLAIAMLSAIESAQPASAAVMEAAADSLRILERATALGIAL